MWLDKAIIAIDTKGDHLIKEAAGHKIFSLDKVGSGEDVVIRLVTKGTWSKEVTKTGNNGYTVWKLVNGKVQPIHADSIAGAVQECFKL